MRTRSQWQRGAGRKGDLEQRATEILCAQVREVRGFGKGAAERGLGRSRGDRSAVGNTMGSRGAVQPCWELLAG